MNVPEKYFWLSFFFFTTGLKILQCHFVKEFFENSWNRILRKFPAKQYAHKSISLKGFFKQYRNLPIKDITSLMEVITLFTWLNATPLNSSHTLFHWLVVKSITLTLVFYSICWWFPGSVLVLYIGLIIHQLLYEILRYCTNIEICTWITWKHYWYKRRWVKKRYGGRLNPRVSDYKAMIYLTINYKWHWNWFILKPSISLNHLLSLCNIIVFICVFQICI